MRPSLNILVIEDDETDRLLIEELVALRGRGRLRVTEARDFAAALGLLETRTFDLILLDTRLRDVSALSAVRALRECAPHTPILPHATFLTAGMRDAARQRGAWDVVARGSVDPLWAAMGGLVELKPAKGAAAANH